ncbi:uncharacterized protein TOT_040000428 [Theileria orientalis strain Shintoku]|uniref:Uncharacterized protein n=1 Tax=Theileria orientalis strain Shintoku TaxID=869250 RepID=J4CE05_THEOR|nr:uncharacterized protein TOT_040000428 [Theileria orientalis strain Shintoku]PVC51393.1 hypothetical protein MACL_00001574 [Theileria orientalis]BAM42052.1 uncharacterized protein TOT_040000428 [Theileria orientalis strain Shintoku]|eukprot:XP_009692353.1 uncharacterized protein TOT_040000428 [Theileria orientalis strain Shintoku]
MNIFSFILCLSDVLTFNSSSHTNPLVGKPVNNDDTLNFPSSLTYKLENVYTLPTIEDNLFHKIPDLSSDEVESEKKLEEINESIKNGAIEDPLTKAKLFQNEEDEQPEVEVKEVSLDSSGENYKEGVESTSQDMNDISKSLESDGVAGKDLDDVQLRDNLLNKIMKSQHRDNLGA